MMVHADAGEYFGKAGDIIVICSVECVYIECHRLLVFPSLSLFYLNSVGRSALFCFLFGWGRVFLGALMLLKEGLDVRGRDARSRLAFSQNPLIKHAAGDLRIRLADGDGNEFIGQIGGFSHESEHDLAIMVSDFFENGSTGAESRCSSDSDPVFLIQITSWRASGCVSFHEDSFLLILVL
ncbi:hypothetical protein HPP92_026703 [Vanilla planifolia]|uniref:Uncharacterized protein n=1 Tax=Vanilla planifolia TaxID=51239 RepID=A0A835U8Y0_VANPL|nr:hypothetical protein HPP92_026703 [Vanilla planifolia]